MKRIYFILLVVCLGSLLSAGTTKVGVGAGHTKVGAGAGKTKVLPAVVSGPVIVGTGKNSVAATGGTISYSPTAGHAMAVWLVGFNGVISSSSVSDNIDGTTGWTIIRGADTDNAKGSWAYKFNMPAGVTTLTYNATSGAGFASSSICVVELTGVTAFTGGESSFGTPSLTTNPQTGNATNATATSIFLAGEVDGASGTETMTINSTGSTPASGWALVDPTNGQETAGATKLCFSVVFLTVGSGSARGHGWTNSSTNHVVAGVLALH